MAMYSSVSELNSYVSGRHRQPMTFLHINMQSARSKEENFLLFLDEFNFFFSVIMMTETWYRSETDVFCIDGYNVVYQNRKLRIGGGVCLYVKAEITYEYREDLSLCTDDLEALTLQYHNYIFVAIYRPPSGNFDSFIQYLENLFSVVNQFNYKLVLGGDLNIDMLSDTHKQMRLSDLLASFFLTNVITIPTRITDTTSTLLDLFITSSTNSTLQAGVLRAPISDHLPIYLVIENITSVRSQILPAVHFQQINPRTLSSFREEIRTLNWNNVLSSSSADLAYDCFIDTLCSVYKKNILLTKL